MAELTADFEAGTNGSPVTTGAGEASATKWDHVSATPPVYDNAHAYGTLSMKAASGAEQTASWDVTGVTDHYGRAYMWFSAFPTTTQTIIRLGPGVRVAQTANDGRLFITNDTVFPLFTTPIATGQWIRLEWHVVVNASTGSIELKLFNDADAATATETISQGSLDTGVYNEFKVGPAGDVGVDVWYDNIVANATAYPGPAVFAPANTVAPVASGSPVVGQNLSVTDGTWTGTAPITFTYQWQRDNSGGGVYGDIGGATNNTYTLVLADLNCNVRCVVTGTNSAAAVPANSNALGPVTNPAPPSGGGQRLSRLVLDTGNKTIVLRAR